MTEPDWVKVGARVATFDNGRGFQPSATFRTINRMTPTLIILDNGDRYRRNTLRESGNHYGNQLLPLDDHRVIRAIQDETMRGFVYEVEGTLRQYRDNPQRDPNAALDRVEQLLAGARARISRIQQPTKEPS